MTPGSLLPTLLKLHLPPQSRFRVLWPWGSPCVGHPEWGRAVASLSFRPSNWVPSCGLGTSLVWGWCGGLTFPVSPWMTWSIGTLPPERGAEAQVDHGQVRLGLSFIGKVLPVTRVVNVEGTSLCLLGEPASHKISSGFLIWLAFLGASPAIALFHIAAALMWKLENVCVCVCV